MWRSFTATIASVFNASASSRAAQASPDSSRSATASLRAARLSATPAGSGGDSVRSPPPQPATSAQTSAAGALRLSVRVLLRRQLDARRHGVLQVPFLDRQVRTHQATDPRVLRLLVQLLQHRPVTDLAGLGHRQELEPVEVVRPALEVRLHH